jgi:hypothetical protein
MAITTAAWCDLTRLLAKNSRLRSDSVSNDRVNGQGALVIVEIYEEGVSVVMAVVVAAVVVRCGGGCCSCGGCGGGGCGGGGCGGGDCRGHHQNVF